MTRYVVDTWAWIEYLDGSSRGQAVREIVENKKNEIITHWNCLAEIVSVASRKNKDYKAILDRLFSLSVIFSGDSEFGVTVGKRHAEIKSKIKDFGLVDACILATAEKMNAKILTGDPHFKGLKESVMI